MADIQQTLIYVGSENIEEAKFMSRNFVNPEIKTRAYINTLGAEVIKNYMASEGLNVVNLHNIHSISKILENTDIADILMPNIHIDVRVVFDKEQIFVPKSHFEKNILPDVYAVVKFDENFKTAEFLGYFQPAIIDKNNSNNDYYFITDKQLISTESFIKTIKDFVGKAPRYITEEDMLRGRQLAVALNDHDLSVSEEKELLELLLMSDSLRESILEFDNFETLAYSASVEVLKQLNAADTLVESAETVEIQEDEEIISKSETSEPEDSLGDDMLEDNEEKEQSEENEEQESEKQEENIADNEQENPEPVIENVEKQEVHAVNVDKGENSLSVDDILDRTIASIDENPPANIDHKKANLASNIVAALGQAAAGGVVAAETMAAAGALAGAAETVETGKIAAEVSESAMKLAGASGELPEKIKPKTGEPLDMTQVNKVESIASKVQKQNFEHETVDMMDMDVVNEGNVDEDHAESLSDMETLVALEGGVNPEDDFALMQGISESEVVDLPMTSNFTINEDGTSNIDMYANMDVQLEDESELISMPPLDGGIGDFGLDLNFDTDTTAEPLVSENSILEGDSPVEQSDEKSEELSGAAEDIEIAESGESDIQAEESEVESEDVAQTSEVDETAEATDDIQQVAEEEKLDSDNIAEPEISEEIVAEPELDIDIDESAELSEPEISEVQEVEIASETLENVSDAAVSEQIEDIVPEKEITQESESVPVSEDMEHETELPEVEEEDINISESVEESLSEQQESFSDIENPEIVEDTEIEEGTENSVAAEITEGTEIVEDVDMITEPSETGADEELETVSQTEVNDELDAMLAEDNIQKQDELDELLDSADSQNEPARQDESWIDDTNYDNLADFVPAKEPDNDVISEPEPVIVVNATENSRTISDKTFTIGEIPIDINNTGEPISDNTPLGNLYTPSSRMPGDALLNNPGRMGAARPQGSKAPVVLGVFGALIVLIIVGIIGFFAAKMLKAPSVEAPQPITDDNVPTSSDNGVSDGNTLNVTDANVLNMDNNTNALASTVSSTSVDAARKSGAATSFVDIKKLTWEVPDYVSYDANFKQYFQSVGKSLKLALVSDLLLATDYIYSSPVKVSVTFTQDGTFKSSQMLNSSGSTQIDSIVLQTVNQTLKSVKAPHSVRNDESTTAILKIYF